MNKKSFLYFIAALIALGWMVCPPADADWINFSGAQNAPNIAEIHINDDHVGIELEIFVRDLVTFDRLVPDEFFAGTGINRASLEDRMQQFSSQDFQVIADGKQKLQATLKLIEPRLRTERPSSVPWKINPYTGQPIPGPPKDKRVLYAELSYPFKGRPKSLTFIPPLDERGLPKASIGFICSHQGVTVVDFRILSQGSTLHLN